MDLGDLATEAWSLLPTTSDFLAEIPTRRFGTLTYAHSTSQPEDITLFNRTERHNLSVYASKSRLALQGPFYNEEDEMDYDVLDYNVDVQFSPERLWLEGHGRLKLRIRSYALGSVTLRLAGALQVRSVVSDTFGRVLRCASAIRTHWSSTCRSHSAAARRLRSRSPTPAVLNRSTSIARRSASVRRCRVKRP